MNTYKRSPILRGDILYAELGAAVGSEQAGFRPVVVVQNDVGNRYSPTVVVAPLTSNIRKNILPTHVHVGRESGRILCPQGQHGLAVPFDGGRLNDGYSSP